MARLNRAKNGPSAPVVHTTVELPASSPADPPEKPDKPDFWSYMQSLSPDDWREHIVYLTRELPKTTIQGAVGGYLTKLQQAFDLEDIKSAYGGYEFSYIMKGPKNQIIYSGKFRVEAPPKYDTREETAGNKPNDAGSMAIVQQFVSVLRDELQHSRENSAQGNPAAEEAISMLSKASEKAMEIVVKQTPQGGSQVQQLGEMLTLLKAMLPPPTPGLTLESLLGLFNSPLLARLLQPVDPMAQITTFLGVFEKLDALRGSGGGEGKPRDWKAALADGVIQKGPEILRELRETMEVNYRTAQERRATAEVNRGIAETMRRGGSAPPAASADVAPPPAAPVSAGPLRSVPLDGSPTTPAPAEAPAAAPGVTLEEKEQSDVIASWVKAKILQLVEEDEDAQVIVDWLDIADPTVPELLTQFDEQTINTFFAGDAILKRVAESPNWPKILHEARHYIEESTKEEEKLTAQTPV